jgi:hypothetical protein
MIVKMSAANQAESDDALDLAAMSAEQGKMTPTEIDRSDAAAT